MKQSGAFLEPGTHCIDQLLVSKLSGLNDSPIHFSKTYLNGLSRNILPNTRKNQCE